MSEYSRLKEILDEASVSYGKLKEECHGFRTAYQRDILTWFKSVRAQFSEKQLALENALLKPSSALFMYGGSEPYRFAITHFAEFFEPSIRIPFGFNYAEKLIETSASVRILSHAEVSELYNSTSDSLYLALQTDQETNPDIVGHRQSVQDKFNARLRLLEIMRFLESSKKCTFIWGGDEVDESTACFKMPYAERAWLICVSKEVTDVLPPPLFKGKWIDELAPAYAELMEDLEKSKDKP